MRVWPSGFYDKTSTSFGKKLPFPVSFFPIHESMIGFIRLRIACNAKAEIATEPHRKFGHTKTRQTCHNSFRVTPFPREHYG